jgi:large subunit ribosomal protein L10
MKTFTQKQEAFQEIGEKISKANVIIFTAFARAGGNGLTVADMSELRKQLRSNKAEYLVQKKTVLAKALENKKISADVSTYNGSLATIFGYDDGLSAIKSMYSFAKTHPALTYFGAIFEGKLLSKDEVVALAKIPSREVLLSQLLGMLTYPLRGFAVVLDQIAKQKSN